MAQIHVLSKETIDQIAAGEVVERPSSVVKELLENAVDAGATAVTVEIRDGGISLIRVTDNGCGIEPAQVPNAFLRHATSKISTAEDLSRISSLGFRGEALSSIAAVARLELITKIQGELTGIRYRIEGGEEIETEEVGAPDGTTFLVRNLFFNTPVRKKFLKQPQTEGGYISDLMEHMALANPNVSFQYINNGQARFHTSGNGDLQEIIYRIYGRDIAAALIPVDVEENGIRMWGFLGKPEINRANRNFEIYFVNGRYVKSILIGKAIEEGYRKYVMQHKFPFAVLHFRINAEDIDVNVHPTKMEVRFTDQPGIFHFISSQIGQALHRKELIPEVTLTEADGKKAAEKEKKLSAGTLPEPFEVRRAAKESAAEAENTENIETAEKGESVHAKSAENIEIAEKGGSVQAKSAENIGIAEKNGSVQTKRTENIKTEEKAESIQAAERTGNGTADYAAGFKSSENSGTYTTGMHVAEGAVYGTAVSAQSEEFKPLEHFSAKPEPAGELPGEEVFFVDNRILPEKGEVSRTPEKMQDVLQNNMPPRIFGMGTAAKGAGNAANHANVLKASEHIFVEKPVQLDFFEEKMLTKEAKDEYHILGQVFDTYWLVAFHDKLFIIDQHAAHEKVKYESFMKQLQESSIESQMLNPPVIVTLTGKEETVLKESMAVFLSMGFEIESFGGNEYALRSVPAELYGCSGSGLFTEMLDELSEGTMNGAPGVIRQKIATMACKAAVKGNTSFDRAGMEALIDQLLTLEDPYHCPHGRPTIISMSKYEIEKKFKRIVS